MKMKFCVTVWTNITLYNILCLILSQLLIAPLEDRSIVKLLLCDRPL